MSPGVKKTFSFLWVFLTAWLSVRFFLPLGLPFLLGGCIALLAEPGVRLLCSRLRLPRPAAAGICVTAALLAVGALLTMICALLLRQLGSAASVLPDMELAARNGLHTLEGGLLELADHSPRGVRSLLKSNVTQIFSGGTDLMDRGVEYVITAAGNLLTHIPGSALGIGTGIIAAFLISVRLPAIRSSILRRLSRQQLDKLLSSVHTLKSALLLWLGAQVKLVSISFCILTGGFLLLRIPHAFLWSLLTSAVDLLPVFGTGTVLVPWSIVSLLQGDGARSAGLAGLYVTTALIRSALEPKLLGSQLGLDPLVTLVALYTGYRLWGVGGMILVPLLTVSAARLLPESRRGAD